MWFYKHIILGIIPAMILAYFGNYLFAILFFLANFLIDIDHFIGLAILDKTLNPFKIFKTIKKIQFKGLKKEKLLCFFHTVEFLFVFGVASYFYSILIPVFYGFVFHFITDILTVARNKDKRIFSSILFFLTYKNS